MDAILRYIEHMKTKPEHVRKRFAFGVSFSITFLIFAGWMVSLGFKSSPVIADKVNKAQAPFQTLSAAVVNAYDSIKSIVVGSNKVEYSSGALEVTPGKR